MVTNAVRLTPLLSRYIVQAGPPKTIIVPNASQLAKIPEITVRGRLLKNQFATWDPRAMKHRFSIGKRSGRYELKQDGSLELCLGVKSLQPHLVCRLPDASAFLLLFNQSIGEEITVSGFLRCSFNNPGFDPRENAHIFEIHPVRTMEIEGELHSFDLGAPKAAITDWHAESGHQDDVCKVKYWKGSDMLVFSPANIGQEDYVRVAGSVRDVTLNVSTRRPAWFLLDNPDVGRQLKVTCLQGTNAVRQLRNLKSTTVRVIGLKGIDLAKALEDRYRINLLGVDIQED